MGFTDTFEPQASEGPLSVISPIAGSPYQEQATRFGNYTDDPNPFGLTGKGAGSYAFAPFVIDENFGRATPNSNVTNTTQAAYIYARYYGPTSDDSAEAASSVVVLVDTGTPFTQAQPTVGFEGIAIAQGGNIVTNKLIGTVGSVIAQGASQVTNAMSFYISTLSGASAAGATITNWYGLYQEVPQAIGTITNRWGAYFFNDLQIDSQGNIGRLLVGVSGVQTNSARALIVGPNVTGGATDVPTLIAQAGVGQTAATMQLRTSGAAVRLQLFGASGNVLIGNGPTGGSGVGIISMLTTTIPSATPPAASAYLYVDPADNKLKAKTSGGTVTVLTPTA